LHSILGSVATSSKRSQVKSFWGVNIHEAQGN
jgi:hypothetical protein